MRLAAVPLLLSLLACFPFGGLVHREHVAGPYVLWATDTMEDMILCRSIEGSACVGDGLPGATIFAAGADERFIVLARHPSEWPDPPNRQVTEYYYIIRQPDETERGPYGHVRGPFDADQFGTESRRLRLPTFSRVFEELQ
jgi:hypothetical protein